ncbi:MAG: DmsC/YnfH family molybdoenzyme membrane anchor subunit [Planctomycetota bacterium]
MSVATTPSPSDQIDFDAVPGDDFDLVGMLLEQQSQLTAVEEFSQQHSSDHASKNDAPAQERYYRSLLPATSPSTDEQFAFEVDLDACSGCKACVVACHTLNGLEENESWRRVGAITIGQEAAAAPTEETTVNVDAIALQHVTTACHHCEDPGCLNGCPVKAYDKDPVTGIVRHLDDQCIGCKYCTMMCPYEVPKYSKRLGIVRKCDMCHHRLAVGEAPACVQSCPNEAIRIHIVKRSESFSNRSLSEDGLVAGAPPSSITLPTTVYKSERAPDIARPVDEGIDHVAESHWPLAAMLIGTQLSVGMLVTERLLALALRLSGDAMPLTATTCVASVALIVAMGGLNLAPLHLGQPLRAWRVFLGLGTSWLSREAVILGKYVGLLVGSIALLALPLVSHWLPNYVTELADQYVPAWAGKAMLGLSLPIGFAGLFSSAMIYIATKRPLWTYKRTLPRFGGTTLIGGFLFAASTFTIADRFVTERFPSVLMTWIAAGLLLSTVSMVIKLVWEYQIQFGPLRATDSPHDRRCRALTRRELTTLVRSRLIIGGLSALIMGVAFVALLSSDSGNMLAVLAIAVAALLTLIGESLERLLYFMSVVYDRMPGILK